MPDAKPLLVLTSLAAMLASCGPSPPPADVPVPAVSTPDPAPPAAAPPYAPPPAPAFDGVVAPAPSTTVKLTGSVTVDGDESWRRVFQLGKDVTGVDVTLETDAGDADLYVAFGDKDPKDDDWTFKGDGDACREHAVLSRAVESDFEPGPLLVVVKPGSEDGSLPRGAAVEFRLSLTTRRVGTPASLVLGGATSGATGPDSAHRADFVVDVPEGVPAVRIDVLDAEADVDLFVGRDAPALGKDDAEWAESSLRARETLVIDEASGPPLAGARKLYVGVVDPSAFELPVRFRIAATAGRVPPDEAPEPPRLAVPADPRDRAVLTVVEVLTHASGGSGTMVSEDGLVLTARHIIDEAARTGEVTVAIDVDATRMTTEWFRARAEMVDDDLDLALLRIVSDVWGRPLPEGYRFVACPPTARAPLRLGEEVVTIGFPSAAGSGTRTPVMFSKGVVSGFEREKAGLRAKTDAYIGSGSSGGGVFDAEFRFVGTPLYTIAESGGASKLGFFAPVAELPRAWLEAIRGGK